MGPRKDLDLARSLEALSQVRKVRGQSRSRRAKTTASASPRFRFSRRRPITLALMRKGAWAGSRLALPCAARRDRNPRARARASLSDGRDMARGKDRSAVPGEIACVERAPSQRGISPKRRQESLTRWSDHLPRLRARQPRAHAAEARRRDARSTSRSWLASDFGRARPDAASSLENWAARHAWAPAGGLGFLRCRSLVGVPAARGRDLDEDRQHRDPLCSTRVPPMRRTARSPIFLDVGIEGFGPTSARHAAPRRRFGRRRQAASRSA